MCGIVGYIGNEQAAPILLDGLAKLEYRGYDSAGIAVYDGTKVATLKSKGRLKVLSELSHDGATLPGTVGIGHTRWATHGSPSDVNAHPHFNKEESIVVVHNGIIENYLKLKKKLEKKGYEFISETDTEVIAHLLDYYYKGNPLEANASYGRLLCSWNNLQRSSGRIVCSPQGQPIDCGTYREWKYHCIRCSGSIEVYKRCIFH